MGGAGVADTLDLVRTLFQGLTAVLCSVQSEICGLTGCHKETRGGSLKWWI